MKIGLGFHQKLLTKQNFRFARQMGATHVVAHLTDYHTHPMDLELHRKMYSYENLKKLKSEMNEEGLEFHAIENFCPAHWHDVLLDGPKKQEQLEYLKKIIQSMGEVGIPILGYNFSIAGVWGLTEKNVARGKAKTAVFHTPQETPIPNGTIWNISYDQLAEAGEFPPITHKQLWQRLEYFLSELLPVAEDAGVIMAAHPDDPPLETLRGHARLVYKPSLYQKLLDIVPSPNNRLEFCLGTIQEMTEGDLYDTIEQYANKIGYIHFRNVRGKVPQYEEVFLDEGDIDMIKALKLLKKHNYQGVLIPDHTPSTDCDAPWHAGMAFALGYMRAAINSLNHEA
ncbi:mannonate dehydratase [Fictibacillus fluitans]|uniref:mannonate dehydratase n=1 Tax=Fictibacillus fluitans TaxID=3058422 RepID=A0ABT8HY56_9BACL|nr:mannonate dehydratase [Fictibacillus sp. NE201]MDN4525182.1 mannonate dehydratase [Fictibacillus sp. NE201]